MEKASGEYIDTPCNPVVVAEGAVMIPENGSPISIYMDTDDTAVTNNGCEVLSSTEKARVKRNAYAFMFYKLVTCNGLELTDYGKSVIDRLQGKDTHDSSELVTIVVMSEKVDKIDKLEATNY